MLRGPSFLVTVPSASQTPAPSTFRGSGNPPSVGSSRPSLLGPRHPGFCLRVLQAPPLLQRPTRSVSRKGTRPKRSPLNRIYPFLSLLPAGFRFLCNRPALANLPRISSSERGWRATQGKSSWGAQCGVFCLNPRASLQPTKASDRKLTAIIKDSSLFRYGGDGGGDTGIVPRRT